MEGFRNAFLFIVFMWASIVNAGISSVMSSEMSSEMNSDVFSTPVVEDFKIKLANYDTGDFSGDQVDVNDFGYVDSNAPDTEVVSAIKNRRKVHFVEGGSMVVTKILPDDNDGLRHQKWVVKLSSGDTLKAVYNSDMCPRVPIREGDVIAMGGMFLWTNEGPMLHWLHRDPKQRRPAGYVNVNGRYYCKD